MENFEIIYSYSRRQAIEDGVLIDVTNQARKLGFVYPVAITAALMADIEDIPTHRQGKETMASRLHTVLFSLLLAIKASKGNGREICWCVFLQVGARPIYELKSICGPGDDAEAVVTIMRPDED